MRRTTPWLSAWYKGSPAQALLGAGLKKDASLHRKSVFCAFCWRRPLLNNQTCTILVWTCTKFLQACAKQCKTCAQSCQTCAVFLGTCAIRIVTRVIPIQGWLHPTFTTFTKPSNR